MTFPSRHLCLLQDTLLVSAERLPDKVALVVDGTSYTYAELLRASQRLATRLRNGGHRRGDRVAIYMDNTWACAVSIFGTLLADGVFLVVNPQTKAEKLQYILNDSGAAALISDGHLSQIFLPALEKNSTVRCIICSGTLPESSARTLAPFDEAIDEANSDGVPAFSGPEAIALDLAALIYTSGSTGNPKGVMMTHQAMTFTVGSLIQYLRLDENDRILNLLPLAFDYGLYQLLMAVRLGATLVLERAFTYPGQILKQVESQAITVFPGVPMVFMSLVDMHGRKPLSFPSVKRVTNTAAALPTDILPKLREIFPEALIFSMYGLTECKRVSYLEPELLEKMPDSVGKAIPGTEVFLLSEDGKPVASGEVGILHVRGPHVMLGYWNQPELSAQMLKAGRLPGERILCTQDFFRMDEQGQLYFVGRSDDIIKSRGEKVSPVEVENCLHGMPGVREAAVVGVPDTLLGEAIRAYVALSEDASLTEKKVQAYCLSKLENFMVPQEVIFLPVLPRTGSGKIHKKSLLRVSVDTPR